jgi:hypothetical protein
MTNPALDKVLEDVYAALHNDNEGLDERILALKIALFAVGKKSFEADPAKIPHPNRQGRKMMQSYFKKRGVTVTFPEMQD